MVRRWKLDSPASGGTLASRASLPLMISGGWCWGDDGRTQLSKDRPSSSCRDSQSREGPANTSSNFLPEAASQGPCLSRRKGWVRTSLNSANRPWSAAWEPVSLKELLIRLQQTHQWGSSPQEVGKCWIGSNSKEPSSEIEWPQTLRWELKDKHAEGRSGELMASRLPVLRGPCFSCHQLSGCTGTCSPSLLSSFLLSCLRQD